MKEKNSIWKKILNYIKNIFSSNQKLLNEGIEEEFIEKIDFESKLLEQNRMILLQRKYELGEMLALSAAPILGGVGLGMIGNDAETNLAKSREGVFQFLNAAIPTWLAGATLRWCESIIHSVGTVL